MFELQIWFRFYEWLILTTESLVLNLNNLLQLKINVMTNNRIAIFVLAIVALLATVYAIYRSLPQKITTVENGNEVVYGEPQHGLILGLLILAAACVAGIVRILTKRMVDKPAEIMHVPPPAPTSTVSSSYRPLS